MDEVTDPFTNFNGATVEVWKLISNFIPYVITPTLLIYAWVKVARTVRYFLYCIINSMHDLCQAFKRLDIHTWNLRVPDLQNELQWLDLKTWHRDYSNVLQGDVPYYLVCIIVLLPLGLSGRRGIVVACACPSVRSPRLPWRHHRKALHC